jgi:hypothetical protein
MSTAPYGIRLLVGVAVTALEETRRLPQTIIMYPMTVASTVAQIVMKMQQDLAGLAIRGDAALETIFPPKDEKPDWATFDEDLPEQDPPPANGERQTEGRFALYSVTEGAGVRGPGLRNSGTAKKRDSSTQDRSTQGRSTQGRSTQGRSTQGRATQGRSTQGRATQDKAGPGRKTSSVEPPAIATEMDYESLTLAQLRARMTALSVDDLKALLAYEEAARGRAPYQTLLTNRITRATAK